MSGFTSGELRMCGGPHDGRTVPITRSLLATGEHHDAVVERIDHGFRWRRVTYRIAYAYDTQAQTLTDQWLQYVEEDQA